jgi:hypothetical protein
VEASASGKTVSFIVASLVGDSLIFTHLPSSYDRLVYNTNVPGINLTVPSFSTKTIQVKITSNGSTPEPGQVFICSSQVFPADMNNYNALWLKVITMYEGGFDSPDPGGGTGGGGSASIPSTWNLKVPSTTGNVYFFVMTEDGDYYASTTPVSSNTTPVTLNLSTMYPF